MKSVLILIADLNRYGGTERAVINLANLLANKYYVNILSVYKSENTKPFYFVDERIKLNCLNLPVANTFLYRTFQYLKFCPKLRFFLKKNNINLVIGTGHGFSFLLPFVVLFLKIKTIAAEHISRESLPFFSKLLQRISYPFISAIVLLTTDAKENYTFCKNSFVIPNSLPFIVSEQSTLRNNTILSVGRLSFEKGYDRLIEIAPFLKQKSHDWQINVYGNGELKNELKESIEKNELSDFIILNDAVANIQNVYLHSDIYMMTSRFEALPMVLLEAKSCGLPVIAYDCPNGPRHLIENGVDGFLIENGNVNSMIEKTLMLMSDYNLRKTMGENALKSIRVYQPDCILNKWCVLLDKIF